MCMGRVIVCCPNCKQEQAVTRPDSFHTIWSYEKPNKMKLKAKYLIKV